MTYAKWLPIAALVALSGNTAYAQARARGTTTPAQPAFPQQPILTPPTPLPFQQTPLPFNQTPFPFNQTPFTTTQPGFTLPPGFFGFQPGAQQLPGTFAIPPGSIPQNLAGLPNPNGPATAVSPQGTGFAGIPNGVVGGYGFPGYGYPGYGYPGYGYPGYGYPGYGYPGMMGAPNSGMYLPQYQGQYAPNGQYGSGQGGQASSYGGAGMRAGRRRNTADANTPDPGTDARQAEVALNAEELMNQRPLREGTVTRAAAANLDVRVHTDASDQVHTYPAGEVFFFRTNGAIATAATAPNTLRTGDRVLVPEPLAKEPRAAVAGSREATAPGAGTTSVRGSSTPTMATASASSGTRKKLATAAKKKKRTTKRSRTRRSR